MYDFFQNLALNETTRHILNEIFSVKCLEILMDVFTVALEIGDAFKGTGTCSAYDDERLYRPFRKYLADYVYRLLLGVETYAITFILCSLLERINVNIDAEINMADIGAQGIVSMVELYAKGIENVTLLSKFSSVTSNQASTLCFNLDIAWRKFSNIKYLHQQVTWQSESLRRAQLILTAHLWLFEEALSSQPGFVLITPINRTAIILQLTKATQALLGWKSAIQKQRDELAISEKAIKKRLEWAVGANPGLQQLMTNFGDHVATKKDFIDKVCLLAAIVFKNCTSVLQYETLRVTTAEALDEDQQFLNLVSRWEKSCMMAQSCSAVVTPAEEALMVLLDPEGPIDRSWLNNVASLIEDMTEQMNLEIEKLNKEMVSAQDELQSTAYRLRALMVTHHRIASNVRSLLKSAQRFVDESQALAIKDYMRKYKTMLETLSELHGTVLSKDFTEDVVNDALEQITEMTEVIPVIFNNLLTFEKCFDKDAVRSIPKGAENDKKLVVPAVAQVQQQESIVSRPNSPSRSKTQKGNLFAVT